MQPVNLAKAATSADKPWADAKAHPCHGKLKASYRIAPVPVHNGMVVSCSHCKRKWPHPHGEDLFAAYIAGYRDARRQINEAADQMAVAIVGAEASK